MLSIGNMIHSIMVFNNDGVPRLVRSYTGPSLREEQSLLKELHKRVRAHDAESVSSSCFLTVPSELLKGNGPDLRVIYRHYATLYFVVVADINESELGILDLIQVFVQILNKCFKDVCELDLVFHWQVLQTALEEMVQAGMVIDCNMDNIMSAIDSMNGVKEREYTRSTFFSRWPVS